MPRMGWNGFYSDDRRRRKAIKPSRIYRWVHHTSFRDSRVQFFKWLSDHEKAWAEPSRASCYSGAAWPRHIRRGAFTARDPDDLPVVGTFTIMGSWRSAIAMRNR
jgi:hypothetical protein